MNAHALAAMTRTETRLFLREPLIWGAAVILPTAVLVIPSSMEDLRILRNLALKKRERHCR